MLDFPYFDEIKNKNPVGEMIKAIGKLDMTDPKA